MGKMKMNNYIIGMLRFKELKKVFSDLEKVPYALIKGEALSIQAYGRCGQRTYGDIDLLISKKTLSQVEDILLKNGFENIRSKRSNINQEKIRKLCLVGSHQLPSFIKKTGFGTIEIDVNFDVFWGQYSGKKCDIDVFISNVEFCDIYGINIKVLTPLYATIQLILHHYKEMNSIYHLVFFNTIKTSMLKDLQQLIVSNKKVITPENLVEVCDYYEIREYAYYVLYYTKIVTNEDLLKYYIEKMYTPDSSKLLNRFGLKNSEYGFWKSEFIERVDRNNLAEEIIPQLSQKSINELKLCKEIFY